MWQNFLDFHNVRSNPSILSIFLLVNDASFSSWSKKKFLSCCLGICMVLIKTKLLGQCEILFFYSTHHPSSLRKLWIIFMNQTLLFSVHRTHQKHQKFCSKYHKYQKNVSLLCLNQWWRESCFPSAYWDDYSQCSKLLNSIPFLKKISMYYCNKLVRDKSIGSWCCYNICWLECALLLRFSLNLQLE